MLHIALSQDLRRQLVGKTIGNEKAEELTRIETMLLIHQAEQVKAPFYSLKRNPLHELAEGCKFQMEKPTVLQNC